MGGDIEQAVAKVRQSGLLVISLNMAVAYPMLPTWWLLIRCKPA